MIPGTRRKKVERQEWTKNIKKRARNSLQVKDILRPMMSCKHPENSKICSAATLTEEDKNGMYRKHSFKEMETCSITNCLLYFEPKHFANLFTGQWIRLARIRTF